MSKLNEISFKQWVDLIISGGKDSQKCDTKDEYKALANLLAGHHQALSPDESLYALGLMVDYETNRAKQPPADGVKPPVEETPEPPADGVKPPAEEAPQPLADGVKPPAEEAPEPPADGVKPPVEEAPEPPADGVKPPVEETPEPPADGVKPPAEEAPQPPADGVNPPVEETPEPPVDGVNPPELKEPATEKFDLDGDKLSLEIFLSMMEEKSVNDWLKHYLSPHFGFDLDVWENLGELGANTRGLVNDLLDKKMVDKASLKSVLTSSSQLLPYIVDGSIAERIDKAWNMDKSDVYELVIAPLIDRLKQFHHSSKDLDEFIKKCESQNPKDMSIEQMQELINEMVKTIITEDKVQIEKIKITAEELASVSYGVANDPENVHIHIITSQNSNKTEYGIEYNGTTITVAKDADGNYSLGHGVCDQDYDQQVENSSAWFGQRSKLADLFKLIETKISNDEIQPFKKYVLNNHDQVTKEVYYDDNGNITKTVEYERDTDGNVVNEIVRDADGNIIEEDE